MKQYLSDSCETIDLLRKPYIQRQIRELALDRSDIVFAAGNFSPNFQKESSDFAGSMISNTEPFDFHVLSECCSVVVLNQECDYSNLHALCSNIRGRFFLLAPTDKPIAESFFENLYEGLDSHFHRTPKKSSTNRDYSTCFMMLYHYGIDPEISILEDGLVYEFPSHMDLVDYFMRIGSIKEQHRSAFERRIQLFERSADNKVIFEMKQKIALLSWRTN